MILNWEPSWPKVDRADYLTSEDFGRGYAALAEYVGSWEALFSLCVLIKGLVVFTAFFALRKNKCVDMDSHGLSFDLQANPHQLKAAAALAAKVTG